MNSYMNSDMNSLPGHFLVYQNSEFFMKSCQISWIWPLFMEEIILEIISEEYREQYREQYGEMMEDLYKFLIEPH